MTFLPMRHLIAAFIDLNKLVGIISTLMKIFKPLFISILIAACSSAQKFSISPEESGTQRLVLVGINDIHGALAPEPTKTKDQDATYYTRGGAAIFASHLKILRETFKDRVLLLDAGDEFQGSIESNPKEGAPMVQYFNLIGLNAAAIGNHEFDFGPVGPEGSEGDLLGALKARTSEAKYPYLAANIIDKETGKPPAIPNFYSHKMFRVGNLNVGVLGLTTRDTPVTTRPDFVKGLSFNDLTKATLRESDALKKAGAHIVILTAHVGLACEQAQGAHHQMRKMTTFQGHCENDDEMVQLLKSLPKGTIDAVVAGHSHKIVNHFVEGVPVIQGETRFHFYNIVHLKYDFNKSKLLSDQTVIEGPVPVCEKVFKNQNDCDGSKPAPKDGRGRLVTPKLYDQSIDADPLTEALLKPVFDDSKKLKSRVLAEAAKPITNDRLGESEMGNLISDAIRLKLKTDIALINGGGIRAPFEQGQISYGDLFKTAPFDNNVSILKVTGKELKNLLRISTSGERGFFQFSGAQVRVIGLTHDAPGNDLNGDKKIEAWEINRLIDAKVNGKAIEEGKIYTVGTVDFLVQGGDNMGWIMKQIPKERINLVAGPVVRDVIEEHITNLKLINTDSNPLISQTEPRIKQETAPAKKKQHRRKKRGRVRR